MAKLRFAILKELESSGDIKFTKTSNGEYLEYNQDVFKDRLAQEVLRIAISSEYGKKKTLSTDKLYSPADIEALIKAAFDRVVNEFKQKTISIK